MFSKLSFVSGLELKEIYDSQRSLSELLPEKAAIYLWRRAPRVPPREMESSEAFSKWSDETIKVPAGEVRDQLLSPFAILHRLTIQGHGLLDYYKWRSRSGCYFCRVGHPVLAEAFIADLRRLTLERRNYRHGPNPSLLHRKELFVSGGYPGRARFARVTKEEEKASLYSYKGDIGHNKQWRMLLERRNVVIRGHRLVRAAPKPKSLGVVSTSPSELDVAPEDDRPLRSTAPSVLRRSTAARKEGSLGRSL